MPSIELLMPKMGESIIEATILTWLKQEGDTIEIDEPILEIATDKVDSEVPSEVEGVLTKILFKEGDVVPVGQPLAIIQTEGDEPAITAPTESVKTEASNNGQAQAATIAAEVETIKQDFSSNGSGKFYSPLVKNIAQSEGVSLQELENLNGTGQDGRVTKHDILAYIKNRTATPTQTTVAAPVQQATKPAQTAPANKPATSHSGNVEIVEMDRMRKLIAKHMVDSKHTSAHVTSFVEADVTEIVNWRNRVKNEFLKREGEKITFTPIFMEAVAKALKEFPYVNASVDGNNIIVKKDINIGMATALPSGNLIVPVIKNADQLNLTGLAKSVNNLANRARNNKLKPDEIQGATYTVTNVGSFGNVMGTPIINQPQVGILAVGAIRKKPAVIETPQGDTIGIRHMMFLSHTYDHRLVDGALGGMFVRKVADYLEQFDSNRTI